MLGGVAVAMWLFTWRTWYYTGFLDMFYGTQAADRSVWKAGRTPSCDGVAHVISSLMMVITMNDPPAFDVQVAADHRRPARSAWRRCSALVRLRALPLNASVLALAGLTGAIVARGSAYPGRFSLHLIPGGRGDLRVRAVVGGYARFGPDRRDPLANCQRRREAGRVDTRRLDHARVHGVALHQEISESAIRAVQLGANAAATRLKIRERHPR